MLRDFITLVKSLNNKSKIVIFCENESLYIKIFKKKIKFFIDNNISLQIVSFKNKISKDHKFDKIEYVNFDNFDILKVYFKLIKQKIIITSTPTINKKISNQTNFFIFVQHTLLKFSNKFMRNHVNDFDKITVSSYDQENECKKILKKNNSIINYKYHNLDYLLEENNEISFDQKKPTLLIATSFYGNHLLKLINENMLNKILKLYKIILRPHPEIYKSKEMNKKIFNLRNNFDKSDFEISDDISNKKIIDKSNYLITDYSGIGLTFSYRKLIPTIFVTKEEKDKILLYENYYKDTLKQIGIIINFNTYELLNVLNNIELNKNNYKEKIKKYKFLQLNYFNKEHNLENFILNKLSKIF